MFGRDVWAVMFAHAQEEYPAECCGIVTEGASGAHVVHRCEALVKPLMMGRAVAEV